MEVDSLEVRLGVVFPRLGSGCSPSTIGRTRAFLGRSGAGTSLLASQASGQDLEAGRKASESFQKLPETFQKRPETFQELPEAFQKLR